MTASLRIAVLNDLHVGGQLGGGFQNPFLSADPALTVAPTVERIRAAMPDLVLVPGDLTHNAADAELAEVRDCLDSVGAPYIVCRGNHDCETMAARSRFDAAFTGRERAQQPRMLDLPGAEGVAVLAVEASWDSEEGLDAERPPLAQREDTGQALAGLDRLRPEWLFVLCHYPFLSQAEYPLSHGGPYAGHVEHGAALLEELLARCSAVVLLVGHNHYHHVMAGGRWLQIATGAIIEYPSEWRLVTLTDGSLTAEALPGGVPAVEAAPPPRAPWVSGRPQDRAFSWRPG
jgi:predicted phosphodiesterase